MVGVPGKSRGCNTCRQRKIACGLQRPICSQCIKSGRACGYHREKVFISIDPAAKTASSSPESAVNGDKALVQSASCQQLLTSFISQCLFPTEGSRIVDKPWLIMLLELPLKTKVLDRSLLALSAASLGRAYGDQTLIHESASLYVRSLSELQRALWNPRLACDDEILAACLTLSMYELMECPSEGAHAYASHCEGILALIQHRGPHAHRSGLARQLFLTTRMQGILYSIEYHLPTYLADPVWMQVPYEGFARQPIDRIGDCLAQAPAIFKEADRLPHLNPMDQLVLANKLVSQCWDLDWALRKCYAELQLSADGPLYWSVLSRSKDLTNGTQGKLFPVAYQFPSMALARTLTMYWATVVMLWSGLYNLYQLIDHIINDGLEESTDGERLGHDLPPLEHRNDFPSAAWHVCRSVEYCMQSEMATLGTFVISTPLAIVIGTLRDHPHCQHEVAWMRAALMQVRERGLRIFGHIRL